MQLALKLPGGENIPYPTGFKAEFTDLSSVVSLALPLLFSIAGIILLAYLVWGGFDYLTSLGDPKKAEAGKQKITAAIIGFIIIFASYWIVQIVDYVFQLGVYTTTP